MSEFHNEALEDTQTVVFRLCDESYGVDMVRVSEIIRPREITPSLETEPHVMGLVNLRGKSVPIVDLRTKLQPASESAAQTHSSRIIVLDTDHGDVGVMVDAVTEVTTIYAEEVEPLHSLVTNEHELFKGVAVRSNGLINLLNLDQALAA